MESRNNTNSENASQSKCIQEDSKCIQEDVRDGEIHCTMYISRELSREESAYKSAWKINQEKYVGIVRNYTPTSCLLLSLIVV